MLGISRPPVATDAVFDDLKIGDLWPGSAYIDQWFAVQMVDERTFIIGEPKSAQYNQSYLIIGDDEAIVYDAGAGPLGKQSVTIRKVVAEYTGKPIRLVLSHFHYDHTAGVEAFDGVTMIDLPALRRKVRESIYPISFFESAHPRRPRLKVNDWVADGETIDLGDRPIQFLNMPGHAPESVVLIDPVRKYAFTGDLVYQHLGGIVLFVPGSDLDRYIDSLDRLIGHTDEDFRFFGAHGLPEFSQSWVLGLRAELEKVKSGKVRLQRASSTLLPFFPLKLHAKGQALIYFTPFLSPAEIYSWPFIIGVIGLLLFALGLLSHYIF